MSLPEFEYIGVATIGDACRHLAKHKTDAKVLAGGTDLLVKMKDEVCDPKFVIGLKGIKGLDKVVYDKAEGLRIGALATHKDVIESGVVQKRYASLAEALGMIGTVQVRNLATVAGNLCNAAPSADSAPMLIALGAKVKLAGLSGEREVALEKFFEGPGKTALKGDEIVTEIIVPNDKLHSGGKYEKLFARTSVDLACVGSACWVVIDPKTKVIKDIKIVLGAVAPIPMRAEKSERVLKGKVATDALIKEAGEVASQEAKPITDIRASKEYRTAMVKVMTRRAIKGALERAA